MGWSSPRRPAHARRLSLAQRELALGLAQREICAATRPRNPLKNLFFSSFEDSGRTENTPPSMPDPGHGPLGVSLAGSLRVRNSHGGLASGRASEARGCPLAGRDRHGDPLHTDLCFWRLLLALCAIATPEAVLGECVAVLLRRWIEPRRRLHR